MLVSPARSSLRQRGGRHQRPAPHPARDGHDRRDLPERWVWDGQQVIPPDWVTASATPYAGNTWTNHVLRPIPPDDNTWGRRGYTYAWWTHEFRKSGHTVPAFYAWGWGGQVIAVFPEHDAVAVFTGAHYNAASSPAKILGAHVIPALLNADAAG